ncbi:OmpA family protein [Parapusillimonas granuli]|uniref:OmpA family protein n=1 Tax=Parapusillimonas granuli TaxID=380911 RepID=A0A853G2C4_9BURK|nr:OmpA family protein [Parapusillimonas granuli]MBB5214028.1 flagellar motor protein MotB [Parapusillimonas granuli]MEB2400878.1 OmpA family protein [Alcaligenaceae bacterium]NYT50449.1 OmpA family protein [Parapusillimonas granuli]
MRDDIDVQAEPSTPVWAVFGDLMSVLLGAFVLVMVGVIAIQLELSVRLEHEVEQRREETQRRVTLEQALARPLAEGRVTLVDGSIGISGSVLFALNSADLQAEGSEVLRSLVEPLSGYLRSNDLVLMVSGFTDDQQVHEGNRRFADNWELSAQRALTVTRSLIEQGIPAASVFAAAFGAERPVASNADEAGRARNRRVEITPVPRSATMRRAAHD